MPSSHIYENMLVEQKNTDEPKGDKSPEKVILAHKSRSFNKGVLDTCQKYIYAK